MPQYLTLTRCLLADFKLQEFISKWRKFQVHSLHPSQPIINGTLKMIYHLDHWEYLITLCNIIRKQQGLVTKTQTVKIYYIYLFIYFVFHIIILYIYTLYIYIYYIYTYIYIYKVKLSSCYFAIFHISMIYIYKYIYIYIYMCVYSYIYINGAMYIFSENQLS